MKDTTLASDLFNAQRRFLSLTGMAEKLVEEELGMVYDSLRFDHEEELMEIGGVENGVRLTEGAHERLTQFLGFTRVRLFHKDGWETYYYRGGPACGHRKLSVRA